jgi:hypothetical protein
VLLQSGNARLGNISPRHRRRAQARPSPQVRSGELVGPWRFEPMAPLEIVSKVDYIFRLRALIDSARHGGSDGRLSWRHANEPFRGA